MAGGRDDPGRGTAARTGFPVRRVQFAYPDDMDPCWCRRFPEFAYAANGVSLIMPFAEPYFVKSIRAVLPDLDEPLASQTRGYLGQELAHHVQHRRFNDLVVSRYPGLARVERWMRRTYGWLGRTRSVRFNVAFAAGSETMAYSLARWSEAHLDDLFADADPVPSTLFLWHLAEEVEHKSAAFDVFEATDGSRLRLALTSIVSLLLLLFFVWASALVMLRGDRRLWSPVSHFRLLRWSLSVSFEILPTLLVSCLPGHHPSQLADPVFLPAWLRTYDPVHETMPIWGQTGDAPGG